MSKKIHVSKVPLLPLYRASGSKSNSLCAYGRTEERATERLEERRRANRLSPLDLFEVFSW